MKDFESKKKDKLKFLKKIDPILKEFLKQILLIY